MRASGLLVPYEKRDEALAQSDMVILLGVPVDDRFDFGTKIPATAQVVAVNESKLQLTLNMCEALLGSRALANRM